MGDSLNPTLRERISRAVRPDFARTLLARRLAGESGVRFLDIGADFLEPDGTLAAETMPDFTHPSEKGYAVWGRALAPLLGH